MNFGFLISEFQDLDHFFKLHNLSDNRIAKLTKMKLAGEPDFIGKILSMV